MPSRSEVASKITRTISAATLNTHRVIRRPNGPHLFNPLRRFEQWVPSNDGRHSAASSRTQIPMPHRFPLNQAGQVRSFASSSLWQRTSEPSETNCQDSMDSNDSIGL